MIDLYELKANIHSRRCFNNEKLFGHVINLSQITCKKLTITYLSNRLWIIFKISEMAYSIAMNWFMYFPRDFGDNWSCDWRSRDLSYVTCIKRILMWFALIFWQRIYWVYSFTMILSILHQMQWYLTKNLINQLVGVGIQWFLTTKCCDISNFVRIRSDKSHS